jgi:glycosyltransferase involved in cell wall biosynthesis
VSLSVCFIARNEERNLPRAIRSVQGVADEIIVADTGSTDRTVELAVELGAKVSHFVWCDDFAAARNFGLDRATGDWVLWLDADEFLLPESHQPLLDIIAQDDLLACFLTRQDYFDPKNPQAYTLMWMPRLFRRHPRLRFRGRCHPDFDPSLEKVARDEGLRVIRSDVIFGHDGYMPEFMPAKLERSARLLELELRDRPGQVYYQVLLARTLLAIDRQRGDRAMGEITEKVLPHRHNPTPPAPMLAVWMEYLLQLPERDIPAGFTRADAYALADRWFPRSAPLIWIRAQHAFAAGRWEQAEKLLRELLAMGLDHSYDRYVNFDPRIIGADALLNLGVCLVRQTKLKEAEACFRQVENDPAHGEKARQNIDAVNRIQHGFTAKPSRQKPPRRRR